MNHSHEQICRHIENCFGPVRRNGLGEFKPDIGVSVHIAGPSQDRVTLFTTGLSDHEMKVPEGGEAYRYAELLIHLPANWPLTRPDMRDPNNFWPVEWLRGLSSFPKDNDTWLGGPSTIVANGEPPEPLGPNTQQSCLLLLHDQAGAKNLTLDDGRNVIFYSVTPLYTEERDLEAATSLRQLLDRFNQHGVTNVVNVGRVNAAT